MFDDRNLTIATVVQGEFLISDDANLVLSTILGSCVAVCLFDQTARVGGMNHFLLPGGNGSRTENIKYGAHAMELLINGLLKRGARRSSLLAKIFGGATMSQNLGGIGTSNGVFAEKFLAEEGIRCVSSSLGGTSARRIKFHPTTGQVRQLLVPNDSVTNSEILQVNAPRRTATDVTLF